MGWNSWDFYGTSATEAQMKAQADAQAEKLLKFGYDTCTLDITWYDDTAGQAAPSRRRGLFRRTFPATQRRSSM